MKNKGIILKALQNYMFFFALSAFLTTCCTMLFVTVLSSNLNVELTGENLNTAAKLTFLNVLLLSLIFTVVDALRRKLTLERPVKNIITAAEKIVSGDFSAKIPNVSNHFTDESLNKLIDCFNKLTEELSSVETLRTDFVASVSHELKTPLAVMQSYGALLTASELSDERRVEYGQAIVGATKKLSDMITNILRLNRLENQQIFPEMERYDLGEQLVECLLAHEAVWEEKGIEIETDIPEGLLVTSDRELLSLVWNNLLSNAFKFTESGGKVSLSLRAEGEFAVVKIRDTGIGITKEVGSRIFEKFYQGDTSRAGSGNGLGLALVKRVVDIIQGEIGVESTVGVGSTFTVKLRRVNE